MPMSAPVDSSSGSVCTMSARSATEKRQMEIPEKVAKSRSIWNSVTKERLHMRMVMMKEAQTTHGTEPKVAVSLPTGAAKVMATRTMIDRGGGDDHEKMRVAMMKVVIVMMAMLIATMTVSTAMGMVMTMMAARGRWCRRGR